MVEKRGLLVYTRLQQAPTLVNARPPQRSGDRVMPPGPADKREQRGGPARIA
jgi:hypothetical protein